MYAVWTVMIEKRNAVKSIRKRENLIVNDAQKPNLKRVFQKILGVNDVNYTLILD